MRALPVAVFSLSFLLLGAGPADAASVGGAAYGARLETQLGPQLAKTPFVELDPKAGPSSADAPGIDLASIMRTGPLSTQTLGGFGTQSTSVRSRSTVHRIDLLDGMVTADLVLAAASSVADGRRAMSRADGSTILGLKVNGQPVQGELTPNTYIDLPGLGYLVINEQLSTGDGTESSGITVNMIHVVRTNKAGERSGEIVIGSAHSSASFLPSDRLP
jgi:hypothetical protein